MRPSGTTTDRGWAGRRWLRARGTTHWSLTLRARARVTVRVRVVDRAGNRSRVSRARA